MASTFNPDKFTPTTSQSLLYSDFFDNLDVHPELHDIVIKKNEDSVKQAILNLILTDKYERPFAPTFGSNLRKHLFEPITSVTTESIQNEISSAIMNFEPRVKLISVVATPYIDQNAYAVTITFYIVNISKSVTLSTILYRVR
jgi:phage baseplate assembly protein W